MIGSRLRVRRLKKTVSVTTYAGAVLYASLEATHTEKLMEPVVTSDGAMTIPITVYYFDKILSTGILPVIPDESRITDSADGLIYEVLTSQDTGGEGNRLKVTTRRYV